MAHDDDELGFMMRWVFITIVTIGVLVAGILAINRRAAPYAEETRTRTYQNSTAHVEGDISELRRLIREYNTADETHREGLRVLILDVADRANRDTLPADVTSFLATL